MFYNSYEHLLIYSIEQFQTYIKDYPVRKSKKETIKKENVSF